LRRRAGALAAAESFRGHAR